MWRSRVAVVYPALASYVVSLGMLAWTPNQAVLLTAGVLAGFGFGSLLPVFQAIASTLPAHRVSIGISTFFILLDLGFGVSPFLLGPILQAWDYRIMFGVCGVLVLLTSGLYWWVHGRFDVRGGVPASEASAIHRRSLRGVAAAMEVNLPRSEALADDEWSILIRSERATPISGQ